MKNSDVAARLFEIAALMEFDEEPFFKIKAYERAARSLEDTETPLPALLSTNALADLPGVGKAISQKIVDIYETGTCKYLDQLRAKFPPTILELLTLPGVGAKTAVALYRELGVAGLDDLRRSIEDGSIRKVPRVGAKMIEGLKARIDRLHDEPKRMRLGDAWPLAQSIAADLRTLPCASNVTVAGSARRMERSVHDIDILCTSDEPAKVLKHFSSLDVVDHTSRANSKGTIWTKQGIAVDCRVMPHACFGNLLQHFTGNKAHNVRLRELALRKGLKVSEYGIEDAQGKVMTCAHEAQVYAALGLQFIPPELRLGLNEIELARKGLIPTLVAVEDIRGDLHAHTDWSDGTRTIEQMASAARERGRDYLSISDHSSGRAMANGLSVERLREQKRAIRKAQKAAPLRLLHSSEVDIRADGTLDFANEVLAELDLVVASIHSSFRASKEQQTQRLLRAINNPYVTIIGHPTGTLIGERDGYEFDVETVFKAAAQTGTALEINSNPARLDLPDNLARKAVELGCTFAIDTDAHYVENFDNIFYGVGTARKAGITKERVVNARSVDEVIAFARRKREKVSSSL
ncbi:MAG: DNA polymerase/3'-5' exonuclease PolX [Candidatus Eremiobacteraeota bacterium]|nr:DNA polymerase/3'-5' exonuclease PolX [Candidatus Eremiobacteraeota bacterium]